jgi:hypothetical protein
MAISFTKYVNIVSGVGGGAGVRQRDLIGRLFSTNNLIPTNTLIEFTTLEDVGTYFGTTSAEYLRASFYFGWVSKNITAAKKISYARWVDANVEPMIFGNIQTQSVSAYTSITNGAFSINIGGTIHAISSLNFSTATTLADVATIITTALHAQTGAQFTGATVTYDATRGSFNLVGGVAEAAVIAVSAPTSGTNMLPLIGWSTGAIFSDGALIETITSVLDASTNTSNNFGSFLFMDALTIEQVEEAAAWANAQNVRYMFCVPVLAVDATNYYNTLKGYAGVGVTLQTVSGEYQEMIPMIILAATNYNARNSVQNYMYQQFPTVTPTVTTTSVSNAYDALRVNYYGSTQTAGQILSFYQRGSLMGGSTAPVDMNTFANEMWLKDAAGTSIMSLLLSLAKVSANETGRAQLLSTLQSVIDQALNNGCISVGKALNNTQKLYIAQITGDDKAWHQIQALGYWVNCEMQSYVTTDGRTEFKAVYTLIYSKDDTVKSVDGTHILI